MRNEPITGKLAGEYRTLLAADSKRLKRLSAVVTIDEENGFSLTFIVESGDAGRRPERYYSLSHAVRKYDER